MIDITKIDPNAPAFGPNSQKVEDLEKVETVIPAAAEQKPEQKEEIITEEKPAAPSEEEPARVKYSRFKTVHDRALQAEKEALEWKAKVEAFESIQRSHTPADDPQLPSYWVEMFGDSEASQTAWKAEVERRELLKKELREDAIRAIREESAREEARTKENVERINQNFEALTDFVGRDLTEKEQESVLDIVDEYTPKDENGNYLGATIPFEKAWEIYELKNQAIKAPKIESRNAVASLSNSPSQGDPDLKAEKDKNWQPLRWPNWEKLVGK